LGEEWFKRRAREKAESMLGELCSSEWEMMVAWARVGVERIHG
jgi:hypothetical protein